ncbi:hypothetical protein BGS_0129 [Beggiatoa sp. SS]|nr:hypothetical protein BGS_0129 [Beggiatoa sp. SS]
MTIKRALGPNMSPYGIYSNTFSPLPFVELMRPPMFDESRPVLGLIILLPSTRARSMPLFPTFRLCKS